MIHYVIACKDLTTYKKILQPTFENLIAKENGIYIEEGGDKSIFQKYNNALDRMVIEEDDVVVFLHDDMSIRDPNFEPKIEIYFKYKPTVGLAGVIGTTEYSERGGWWLCDRTVKTRGRIIQGHPQGREYTMEEKGGMDNKGVVAVDGCIMFMRGSIAKTYRFDAETYSDYHFYDVDSCFEMIKLGYDIGIIDVTVKHESEGQLPLSWHEGKEKFLAKWKGAGLTFPVTLETFK